jgi:hypothetical protein
MRLQRRIADEKASSVTCVSSRVKPDNGETEISLLFFSSPPGRPKRPAKVLPRFRFDDQSRIAGICREIRRAGF